MNGISHVLIYKKKNELKGIKNIKGSTYDYYNLSIKILTIINNIQWIIIFILDFYSLNKKIYLILIFFLIPLNTFINPLIFLILKIRYFSNEKIKKS